MCILHGARLTLTVAGWKEGLVAGAASSPAAPPPAHLLKGSPDTSKIKTRRLPRTSTNSVNT